MEPKVISVAIISVVAGLAIGFITANRLNRNDADALRAEISRLQAAATVKQPGDTALSDAEIRERIKQADDNPADLEYQRNLGLALYRYASSKQDVTYLKESTRLLSRVLASDPTSYDTNVALGNAYFDIAYYGEESSVFDTARGYYEAALKKRPDDAAVVADYGLTYFLQQPPDFERALAQLERAKSIDPKNQKALEFITQIQLKRGDLVKAQAALDNLKAVNPANSSIPGLTAALTESGQPSK